MSTEIEHEDIVVETHEAEIETFNADEQKESAKPLRPREEQLRRMAKRQAEEQGYQPSTWGSEEEDGAAETKEDDRAAHQDEESVTEEVADEEQTEGDDPGPGNVDKSADEPDPGSPPQSDIERRYADLAAQQQRLLEQLANGQLQMQQQIADNQRQQQHEDRPLDADADGDQPDYYEQLSDAAIAGDADQLRELTQQHDRELLRQSREMIQRELEQERVTREFREQYPDIASDGTLWDMANNITVQQMQDGKSLSEAAGIAGQAVTQWVGRLRGGAPPKAEVDPAAEPTGNGKPETVVTDDTGTKERRVEKKRETVVQFPTASGRHQPKAAPKEPTPSEMIALMRQRRMQ